MPVQVTPYVPRTITVHMGAPDEWAENVTVSFPDYVKNVASSEIYPTWEPAAIQANILAIISFALNRVYTEFYPSRGYDFQITSTTAYDQKFIRDRNIFENISRTVDEMFSDYIRREGFVEPLAAKFCNGTTSTCAGLSQWGSQELAQQGYGPMEILRYYYGDDIELVEDAPVQSLGQSYPGYPLRLGSTGPDVVTMKTMLNRISQGYPAIPKLWPVTRTFDEKTQSAVRTFQSVFGLTADGVVGKATWYKMVYLYVGLSRLSELVSMGQQFQGFSFQYPGILRQGDGAGTCRCSSTCWRWRPNSTPLSPIWPLTGSMGPAQPRRCGRTSRAAVSRQTGWWARRPGTPSTGTSPASSGICATTTSTSPRGMRPRPCPRRAPLTATAPPAATASSPARTWSWGAAIRKE